MDYRVIISNPRWELSGVNTHSVRLMRNLGARGIPCEFVVTIPGQDLTNDPTVPRDVVVKNLSEKPERNIRERWTRFYEYLNANAPCIYIIQYDFECSCIVPTLGQDIGVIDVMQSDEDYYYRHAENFHPYWNAMATVSSYLRDRVQERIPSFAKRTHFIANGVTPLETRCARPQNADGPLRIIYSGRIAEHQKRISDIAALAEQLANAGFDYKLTLAGDGPDMPAFRTRVQPLIDRGLVELPGLMPFEEVMQRYGESDVLLLMSGWEGLSNTMLEAMNAGCVPLVTDIPSGVPDVIEHNRNGLIAPVGDIEGFAAHLQKLKEEPATLERLSQAAWRTIQDRFSASRETDQWQELLERTAKEMQAGSFQRPRGKIRRPQHLKLSYRVQKGIARRLPFGKKEN